LRSQPASKGEKGTMSDSPVKMDESHGYKEPSAQTVARDGEVPVSVLEDGSLDPVYEAKAKMLNKAMQDIGMGKYQWQVSTQSSTFSHLL